MNLTHDRHVHGCQRTFGHYYNVYYIVITDYTKEWSPAGTSGTTILPTRQMTAGLGYYIPMYFQFDLVILLKGRNYGGD